MLSSMKTLVGLLIVIAGIAYYVTMTETGKTDPASFFMADWQQNPSEIEAISKVQLSKNGENIVLVKSDQMWSIENGFFANTATLSEMFQSLQSMEVVETKTANPKNHSQLELAENDLKIAFFKGNEKAGGIHIGKSTDSGLVFVRKENESQTFTVSGLKPVVFNQESWQMKTVLDFPAIDVNRIEFNPVDGEPFVLQRNPDDGSLDLTDMPDGFQLKEGVQLNSLAAGLTQLMIESAVPVSLDGLSLQANNTYHLKDGETVELSVYQKGEQYYLTLAGDGQQVFKPWMMEIAAYKFNALNKRSMDVIESVEKENIQADDEVE